VGLHPDPGRAGEARHQGLGHQDRTLLRANGIGPAPRRGGPTWSEFLRSQAEGILALDFFTAETVLLETIYGLFAIHLSSRRVHVLGVTRNPDSAWITQQARNLAMGERFDGIRFAITSSADAAPPGWRRCPGEGRAPLPLPWGAEDLSKMARSAAMSTREPGELGHGHRGLADLTDEPAQHSGDGEDDQRPRRSVAGSRPAASDRSRTGPRTRESSPRRHVPLPGRSYLGLLGPCEHQHNRARCGKRNPPERARVQHSFS
jgi:hypothetical protein